MKKNFSEFLKCPIFLLIVLNIICCSCQNSKNAETAKSDKDYIPAIQTHAPSNEKTGSVTGADLPYKVPEEADATKNTLPDLPTTQMPPKEFAETIIKEESDDYQENEETDNAFPGKEELTGYSESEDEAAENAISSENETAGYEPSPANGKFDAKGFQKKETDHFILYEEGNISQDFATKAETARAKVMSFLEIFSPRSRDTKLSVYLSRANKAPQFTRMHSSDAIADLLDNKHFFLYKNSNYEAKMAHEIAHYYIGTFFPPDGNFFYWLEEGLAIHTQIELYGEQSAPYWFQSALNNVKLGIGYPLEVLTVIDDLEGAQTENIRIWYGQAYSFTKYLIGLKGKKTFYSFCERLKNGYSTEQALYMTYFKSMKEIEKQWHKDIFYSQK